MNTTLRLATLNDSAALSALKLVTFRETFLQGFKIPYPPADLATFEQENYAPDAVARSLADGGKQTWVVECAGTLLGYAHVGPSKLPHPDIGLQSGELYQLYLLNEAQGMGLGKQLLDTALAWLAYHYPGALWLGVWSGNIKAQQIYHKNGFSKAGEYEFPVGSWRDHEFIYRRG